VKQIVFNGFYIVGLIYSLVAAMQDKWPIAIWIALLLVLVTLDQIHDTLKAGTKGQP
jgi:hypothetical protein